MQGARKPHAKNDITTLRKRAAKRGPRVNSALAKLRFFFPRCVCHGLSANYSPGVNRAQGQVEIARLRTRWMKAASDKNDLCRDKASLTKTFKVQNQGIDIFHKLIIGYLSLFIRIKLKNRLESS